MKNLILIASRQAIAILLTLFYMSIVKAQAPTSYCGHSLATPQMQAYIQQRNTPLPLMNQSLMGVAIPIHFWIVRDNLGTNFAGPSIQQLDTWLSQVSLNFHFTNNNNFSRCGVTYLNSDIYTNLFSANYANLHQQYVNPNALNVYIVNNAQNAGLAFYPLASESLNKMIVIHKNYISNVSVLTHELGHSFSLLHTHEDCIFPSTREQVLRNPLNCENKGDRLCDTPADYGPNGIELVYPPVFQASCNNDNCVNGTCLVKDDNNIPLQPDYTNFMSYHNISCQNHFSAEQQAEMNKTLYTNPTRSFLLTPGICQGAPAYGTIEVQCPSVVAFQNANVNMTYQNGASPCNTPSTLTNTYGEFISCNLNTANTLTINPTKNTDYLNGVSTFDISLIQKHILDIIPITDPYKLVAADVSNSGDLDAADILIIRQLILRTTTAYPNMGSWRFIPKRYLQTPSFLSAFNTNPFTASIAYNGVTREYMTANSYMNSINFSLSSPDAAQNVTWSFAAVKMGDVSCNASGSLRIAPNRLVNATTPISIKSGKEATVLIKAKYAGKISTFQAGFKFTNSSLQVISIEKGDFNAANDLMDYIKQDNGDIRTLWYNEKAKAKNFNSGVTVLKLKVKALKDIDDLLSVLALDEAVLQSEFYDDTNQKIPMEMTLEADANNTPISDDAYSVKVYPNPFTNAVTLEVTSATKENAALAITSSVGAPVYSKRVALEVGVNTITIDNTASFPTGILSYTIQFGNRVLNGTINKSR